MITSKRFFLILLAGILLVAAGTTAIVYLGSNVLKTKGDELAKLKVTQDVLAERQTALQRAKKDIAKYEELEKIARAIVPHEKHQGETIIEITEIAKRANIPLPEITFDQSDLGETKKKSSGKKKAANLSGTTQVAPIEGISGLYAMGLSIKSGEKQPVTYDQLLTFLHELSKNRRTAHITSINIQPNADDRDRITFSANINVYIKP